MMIIDNLQCDLSVPQLEEILIRRLENFFFIEDEEKYIINKYHYNVLNKVAHCFLKVDNKYFIKDGRPYFSYIHSGQYLIYLYFFSKEFANFGHPLKEKLYYLNKVMHSVDIYCEVELPKVFFFEHPIGMVLGRAIYGDNFFAMQGCTVGGNKGKYPIIGKNVKMFSNSKIIGKSIIGDNVWVAANAYIKDTDIPSNSIVFGQSPNLIIKGL